MVWNISFPLDDSHNGTYYGSAWFAVRVNGKIQRKWVHKFDILGEPIIILTPDKCVMHLDLRNTLWNAYSPSTSNVDKFIRWMLCLRDYDEVVYTAKIHILRKWLQFKHTYKYSSIESISRFQCPQAELVKVMPFPFSMLFEQWG